MKFHEGTENEVTLRVVLASEAHGNEYFDHHDTIDEALAAIREIVESAVKESDGVERIVGIAIVPKDQYGDESGYGYGLEGDELSENQIAAVYEFYTRQLRITYGEKAEAMAKRNSVEEIIAGFEGNAELKAIISK
jgi:hypothetical protein